MRVAVLSDIHANYHALEAVLAAVEHDEPDEVWSLGDAVGYGPRPNRCCATIAARASLSLAGNHDLAVLGELSIEEFSPDAAVAARWSAQVLEPDARTYLEPLEPTAQREGAELFHASPRDPIWEYVLTEEAAADAFALTSAPLVLVGHSHVALAITNEEGRIAGGLARAGAEVVLEEGRRWLLNPGSVGQPRDGDPRAAWLMVDFGAGRASFRRVPYDVEKTQEEIAARGLPYALAARLALGQ